jgi:predicted anti-sigma-YlaC factor YlaD
VATKHLICRDIVELVTEYLEEVLPGDVRDLFESHLVECDGCLNYLDQMRETIRLTGALRQESLPQPVREALVSAWRRWHTAPPGMCP